jgi:hypothetical protein
VEKGSIRSLSFSECTVAMHPITRQAVATTHHATIAVSHRSSEPQEASGSKNRGLLPNSVRKRERYVEKPEGLSVYRDIRRHHIRLTYRDRDTMLSVVAIFLQRRLFTPMMDFLPIRPFRIEYRYVPSQPEGAMFSNCLEAI